MRSQPSRGVFWVTDKGLVAVPFHEGALFGVAKSGATLNHKELWNEMMGTKGKPYNYYPRGRVEINNKGRIIIYLSPHIDAEVWLSEIKNVFGAASCFCEVRVDGSGHYKCHLDEGWCPDRR